MSKLVKGSPAAMAWAKKMKKARIRAAGKRTETQFFGPGGYFADEAAAKSRKNQPTLSGPMLLDYLGHEGWKRLDAHSFSRTVGSLFQILRREGTQWRVLYRTFLSAGADPALSLGIYAQLDNAMIAANRQAGEWMKKNPEPKTRTHQLTNSEADALYRYANSIRNRGKHRYALALYEYVLGGQRGLGPDWKSYGIQIMTEQAVRMRFAALVPALMKYDENPRPRRTKKYRQGVSAYDLAVQHGFPYIRGEGRSRKGVWYNRFTKTADGSGPALYVGYNEATRRWLIHGDEPLYKDMTLEEVQKATRPPTKNPITIVGNPPNGCANPPEGINAKVAGVLYCNVIEIQAEKKVKHKGFWYHPFKRKSRIQMLALDNGDLCIHSVNGTPLWMRE